MIYSKRRKGGQRKYYTRKSFRLKQYKHYGGAGADDKSWINDKEEKSINNLIDELKMIKNPGDDRRRLEEQLKTILISIVERAEHKKNDVYKEYESINQQIHSYSRNTNKENIASLHALYIGKLDALNMMRSNYNSALQYQKAILDVHVYS